MKRVEVQQLALGIATSAFLLSILTLFNHPAHAEVSAPGQSSTGYFMCNAVGCQWGDGPTPNPYIRFAPPMDDEGRARDKQWIVDCDPQLKRRQYGVMHYTYSKPGCEFGSPE